VEYFNNVVSAMKMASIMHECQPKTSVEAEEEQQQQQLRENH
jgi:hypothetical protein